MPPSAAAPLAKAFDHLGGIGVTTRGGEEGRFTARDVAAERDHVADTGIPIVVGDRINVSAGCADAGEMGSRHEFRVREDPADRVVRAFACAWSWARDSRFLPSSPIVT